MRPSKANWDVATLLRNLVPKIIGSFLHLSSGILNAALITWYQIGSPHFCVLLILTLHLPCSPPFLHYWTKLSWVPCCFCALSSPGALNDKTAFPLHPGWIEQSLSACRVSLDDGVRKTRFLLDRIIIWLYWWCVLHAESPFQADCSQSFIIETPQGIVRFVERKCFLRFKRLGFVFESKTGEL